MSEFEEKVLSLLEKINEKLDKLLSSGTKTSQYSSQQSTPAPSIIKPSEIVEKNSTSGEIDVPEASGTISWADVERDSSGWLGNTMQWAYYTNLRRLEPFIKESEDAEFLKLWRYFQTSDHLYYMFNSGGGPGEVHSYFSPFSSPMDAFVAAQSAIFDFENRVRTE